MRTRKVVAAIIVVASLAVAGLFATAPGADAGAGYCGHGPHAHLNATIHMGGGISGGFQGWFEYPGGSWIGTAYCGYY